MASTFLVMSAPDPVRGDPSSHVARAVDGRVTLGDDERDRAVKRRH